MRKRAEVRFKKRFIVRALFVVAAAAALGPGVPSASAAEGEKVALECELVGGLVDCTFITAGGQQDLEGESFTVDAGGEVLVVTVTNPSIRSSVSCGNTEGTCWGFITTPQLPPVAATAEGDADGLGLYPCVGDPAYTCAAEAPTGPGVTAIHNDGATVTLDPGNNGADDGDKRHDYNASEPAGSRQQAQAKRDVLDAISSIPEGEMAVITAANGYQSSAQQENAFSLEQQLWERGQPYMVCFDPITYTVNGEEVTVQPDCVIITPN
ncbi:MAG: hypothetical protein F4153_05190 [Acidimicrobiia bacterium]|nr:hypothetical protein [Acidimicrobiia bacterium]